MTEPLLITSRTDWTPELIERVYREIETIAYEELELKDLVYPNQLEIITAEQMIDAYASIGLPVHYSHWSFGKDFLKTQKGYERGHQGLAYEIVINSSPCISYLMEENSMMMQALVIAHAAFGHNAVFKNNVCFRQWTNAGSIVDYMVFARNYVRQCEERYGPEEVEHVLDAAHALALHGVDKFKRKHKPTLSEEERLKRLMAREEQQQREMDIILKKTSFRDAELDSDEDAHDEDEENLLYFIMKKSPSLEQWKREILRIVYKVNQYFYPQGQCVTGENLISAGSGLLRLDELVQADGYNEISDVQLITTGDRLTSISHTYLNRQQRVLKLTTKLGRTIIGTPEHPLMSLKGEMHDLTKLASFRPGDHLVLNTNYKNVFSTTDAQLEPVSYSVSLTKSVNAPTMYPSTLTPELAELLGYLRTHILSYSGPYSAVRVSDSGAIVFRCAELLKNLFGIDTEVQKTMDDPQIEQDLYAISLNSYGLKTFLMQNNLIDDSELFVKPLRLSSEASIRAFARAYIDSRATCRNSISEFALPMIVDEHAAQLQQILGFFGIMVRITKNGLQLPVIRVLPSSRKTFESLIGTVQNINEDAKLVAQNDVMSVIPGAKALLSKIASISREQLKQHQKDTDGLFWAQKVKNGARFKDTNPIRRSSLPVIRGAEVSFYDVINQASAFEYACSLDIEPARQLKVLLEISDGVFYDEVESVEVLGELRDVYDVTVPENHLFWMSGMISHNTQTLNEGFASFTHYYIMTRLEEKGILTADAFLAFLQSHAGVLYQPTYLKRYYNGINPYALGFAILMDLKRICTNPTIEDREWFPQLIGQRWQDVVKEAVFEHRDDSFIQQYLSPKVIRDFGMFSVNVNLKNNEPKAIVSEIHDEIGYHQIRTNLARSYERIERVPQIVVRSADLEGDRVLHLEYVRYKDRDLDEDTAEQVTDYVDYLWGYPVELDC